MAMAMAMAKAKARVDIMTRTTTGATTARVVAMAPRRIPRPLVTSP